MTKVIPRGEMEPCDISDYEALILLLGELSEQFAVSRKDPRF